MWNDMNSWETALLTACISLTLNLYWLSSSCVDRWRSDSFSNITKLLQLQVKCHTTGNMLAVAQGLRPAESDEIYLESRSSEQLLRNGISDISEGRQWTSVKRWQFVLRADRLLSVPGMWMWTLGTCSDDLWTSALCAQVSESDCYSDIESKMVSFMMTPAHVLRLVSMPEPEKVDPLVLPWQQGENLLGLPTVWMETD